MSALTDNLSFTAPASAHEFSTLLFDMDGTIIDSTAAIEQHWHSVGASIGVDPNLILATSHGRRSIDVLAQYAPHLATWEHITPLEASIPHNYASSAAEIPGARALLASISALPTPHPIWAIVTSGTKLLVRGWLDVMGLAAPETLVSAEEVQKGKPDPEGYLLGNARVEELRRKEEGDGGEKKEELKEGVLVLEDSPAGIRAGKAAGFSVLAVVTTHRAEQLIEAGADWIVRDLESVKVLGWEAGRGVVRVEVRDGLEV